MCVGDTLFPRRIRPDRCLAHSSIVVSAFLAKGILHRSLGHRPQELRDWHIRLAKGHIYPFIMLTDEYDLRANSLRWQQA